MRDRDCKRMPKLRVSLELKEIRSVDLLPASDSFFFLAGNTAGSSRLAIANLPKTLVPGNQVFIHKVFLESTIAFPICNAEGVCAFSPFFFQMASNVIHPLLPACWTNKFLVAAIKRTDRLLGGLSELKVAACLVLPNVVVSNRVHLVVSSAGTLRSVHTAKMLRKKIFAIEVVVI